MSRPVGISEKDFVEISTAPDFSTAADPVRSFADAVFREIGIPVDPVADGKIHRFDCPDGKKGNKAGWYVLFLDRSPAGAFGNWRTGLARTWRHQLHVRAGSKVDVGRSAAIEAAIQKRELEKNVAIARAAHQAEKLWNRAQHANAAHPYLAKKRIPALFLRQYGDCLLIPMRRLTGQLANLQKIYPDGNKRFLKGGQISGTFALFGREVPKNGKLYICEGWATAATIATTLRLPVVATMTAGNLLQVAQGIRMARPGLALTIAADDDHHTPGNPGIAKGLEAARMVRGEITWPTTCRELDCGCSDFNDTAHCGRAVE